MGKFTLGALTGFTVAVVLSPLVARGLRQAADRLEEMNRA